MKRSIYKTTMVVALCLSLACLAACSGSFTEEGAGSFTEEGAGSFTEEGSGSTFPENAFNHFLDVSAIPRGSHNEQAISDYLVAFGEEHGLETYQDEALNVLIKKDGTKGRENEPPVILQAHMDMVCEKNSDSTHDFLTDPIIPVTDGDWVQADGTTLGADNGVGVAMLMSVLESDSLSHPPLEAIFTTSEEEGMTGAMAFDASLLDGQRLINVDYETEGVFAVSSAANTDVDIIIPVDRVDLPESMATYSLAVKGLTGGHSGIDINKGRANANLLMSELLIELGGTDLFVVSIDGGSARNAIPRECSAVISFDEANLDAVQSIVRQAEAAYRDEYTEDADLSVTMEETSTAQNAMDASSTQRVLDGITQIPVGVISMSPDIEGLVQTSNNLGVVATGDGAVTLLCYPRSSSDREQAQTLDTLRAVADSIGAQTAVDNERPPWPYKADSPLREKMAEIYADMYGTQPTSEAVHAGLECGIFAAKIPDADIIAIGPDILGAHSPDEKLSRSSFDRTCEYLVEVLNGI